MTYTNTEFDIYVFGGIYKPYAFGTLYQLPHYVDNIKKVNTYE